MMLFQRSDSAAYSYLEVSHLSFGRAFMNQFFLHHSQSKELEGFPPDDQFKALKELKAKRLGD